jgi:hypothetical protein
MSKVARAARTATEVRQEAVRVGAAAVMEHNTHHAPWLTVLSLEVQQEAVTVGAAAVVMCDKKGNAALIRTSMPHGKMSRSWLAFTLVRVPLMFAKER